MTLGSTFRYAILAGPTGSGKTSLVCQLDPERFEVVSFDSRQVFTDLSIGTTAPTQEEKKKIAHHLVSFLPPNETLNAKAFVDRARDTVLQIIERNKIPILVAGTGFYLRAFLQGMFPVPDITSTIRNEVFEMSSETASALLKEKDPKAWQALNPEDMYRIKRALEVVLSGNLWSEVSQTTVGGFWREFPKATFTGRFLDLPRSELYAKINLRAKELVEEGMIEETKRVSNQFGDQCYGLKSLGYNFALAFLKGEIDGKNFLDSLAQSHRNYAKRQVTWFRKETYLLPISKEKAIEEFRKID